MNQTLNHVAIIMDGNGRWAKKQHQARTFGHFHGVDKVREIAIAANEQGIQVLTLFAFSTENWKRPIEEVDYLMQLPAVFFSKFLTELMEKNIRIQTIGDLTPFPEATRTVLMNAIKTTAKNSGMILVFAMNYGSRDELVRAARAYAADVSSGQRSNSITESEFEHYLMTREYPPVDLCIRTSGEQRLSNFLLWQLAYAELVFTPLAWPELTAQDFVDLLKEGSRRERRFGGIV